MATEVTNEGFDALIAQPIRCVKVILELFELLDHFAFLWGHSGSVVDYWRECESIILVDAILVLFNVTGWDGAGW